MPDENIEKVGIQLTVEGEGEFTNAARRASSAVEDIGKKSSSTASALTKLSDSLSTLTMGLGKASQTTQNLSVASMALGTAAGHALYSGLQKAVTGLMNINKNSVAAAGRFEEMTDVAVMMGSKVGKSAQEITGIIEGIRSQGIEADTATNLITEMVRSEMDLGKAVNLAKVAQDAAIISNSNSTDTLARLEYGIMRYDSQTLRSAGIMVNMDLAMRKYADSVGKATSMLTPLERQQAAFNAVLEEGVKIEGAYDTATSSAFKMWGSYTRVVNDLTIAMGAPFQGVSLAVVNTLTKLTQGLRYAIEPAQSFRDETGNLTKEGKKLEETWGSVANISGILNPAFETVAGTFQGLVQVFADGAMSSAKSIAEFVSSSGGDLESFAYDAFTYGINIMTQFGAGIIEGAADALASAMDFVSGMLDWFLAPGSPPRVAKELPEWGQSAMEQFLMGFEDADFTAFDKVQSQFKQGLQMAMDLGEIDEGTFKNTMLSMSNAFGAFLSGGGAPDDSFYQTIESSMGPLSTQISSLTKKYVELLQAQQNLANFEQPLLDAQNAETSAVDALNKAMSEYNAAIVSGAGKTDLEKKRAEVDAANAALEAAKNGTDQVKESIIAAQDKIQTLEKEVSLQEKVNEQLNEMNDIMSSRVDTSPSTEKPKLPKEGRPKAETPEKRGGGGGGGGLLDKDAIDKKMGEIQEKVKGKVAEIAEDIRTRIKNAWDDAFGADTSTGQALQRLRDSWERFTTSVSNFYNEKVKPVYDELARRGLVPENAAHGIGELVAKLAIFGLIAGTILGTVAQLTGGIVNLIITAASLSEAFATLGISGTAIVTSLGTISSVLAPVILIIGTIIGTFLIFQNDMWGVSTTAKRIALLINYAFDSIKEKVWEVVLSINEWWAKLPWNKGNTELQNSVEESRKALDDFKASWRGNLEEMAKDWGLLDPPKGKIADFGTNAGNTFTQAWGASMYGAQGSSTEFVGSWKQAMNEIDGVTSQTVSAANDTLSQLGKSIPEATPQVINNWRAAMNEVDGTSSNTVDGVAGKFNNLPGDLNISQALPDVLRGGYAKMEQDTQNTIDTMANRWNGMATTTNGAIGRMSDQVYNKYSATLVGMGVRNDEFHAKIEASSASAIENVTTTMSKSSELSGIAAEQSAQNIATATAQLEQFGVKNVSDMDKLKLAMVQVGDTATDMATSISTAFTDLGASVQNVIAILGGGAPAGGASPAGGAAGGMANAAGAGTGGVGAGAQGSTSGITGAFQGLFTVLQGTLLPFLQSTFVPFLMSSFIPSLTLLGTTARDELYTPTREFYTFMSAELYEFLKKFSLFITDELVAVSLQALEEKERIIQEETKKVGEKFEGLNTTLDPEFTDAADAAIEKMGSIESHGYSIQVAMDAATAAVMGLISALQELDRYEGGGDGGSSYKPGRNFGGRGIESIPGEAKGGPVVKGRTYLVGEKGPELFHAPLNGGIIPNNITTRLLQDISQSIIKPTGFGGSRGRVASNQGNGNVVFVPIEIEKTSTKNVAVNVGGSTGMGENQLMGVLQRASILGLV